MPKTCIRTFMVSAFEGKYGDFVSDVGLLWKPKGKKQKDDSRHFHPFAWRLMRVGLPVSLALERGGSTQEFGERDNEQNLLVFTASPWMTDYRHFLNLPNCFITAVATLSCRPTLFWLKSELSIFAFSPCSPLMICDQKQHNKKDFLLCRSP